jgi:hypothetical protein
MTTFTIDTENNITAHPCAADAKNNPEAERFASAKDLSRLASKWTGSRLTEIWNSLPGRKPVKKFTSRDKAAARIWEAIQTLVPETGQPAGSVATNKARTRKRVTTPDKPATSREGSKTAQILELLKQPGGATLKAIMTASEWQAHSVRGFISGTLGKKMGLSVTSTKADNGERTYSINSCRLPA